MESFRPFSPLHALVLVLIALGTTVAIVVRRRRPPDAAPGRVERAIGLGYLALWTGTFVWLLFPPKHDPATTYPLQLCHWVAAGAGLVLVLPRRGLRAFVYFCGLALCTQALITPNLREGPAFYPFWFFWVTHALIVGVPLYDVVARGYRPTLRDYGIACLLAALYLATVLPVDLVAGWNYGFLGPGTAGVASIVDVLGPWPQRLASITAIAAGAMALLLVPWLSVRRSPSARR